MFRRGPGQVPGIDEIFNIVDWYLLHNQAFSRRFSRPRLHDLKTALVKLISMTLDRSLPPHRGIHHSFVSSVIEREGELPAFISMNYDIVLDKAIRTAGYGLEYGFYGRHSDHFESGERGSLSTSCMAPSTGLYVRSAGRFQNTRKRWRTYCLKIKTSSHA
jgi:hypothetical protein